MIRADLCKGFGVVTRTDSNSCRECSTSDTHSHVLYTHTCARARAHACTHACTRTHAHTHTHTRMHARMCARVRTHTHMHIHLAFNLCASVYTYMYTCTCECTSLLPSLCPSLPPSLLHLLQSLSEHIHMQQFQEPQSPALSQCHAGVLEHGHTAVIECQFLQSCPQ